MAEAPDLAHLAKLANLLLTDEERAQLAKDCAAVLEAFHLEGVGSDAPVDARPCPSFEDKPRPSALQDVESIVADFPRRDGRYLRP